MSSLKEKALKPAEKVELQMTPMIDCTFLLLIFFMLTLKIVPDEGDFNVNMPLVGAAAPSDEVKLPPIKVRLLANPDGTLNNVIFGQTELGNDANAFKRLNTEVGILAGRSDQRFSDDLEFEIDPDYNLHHQNLISAVSACTGYMSPQTNTIVRYVEKIRFAQPRKPAN
jgi:biopolymer transport protein ExbD